MRITERPALAPIATAADVVTHVGDSPTRSALPAVGITARFDLDNGDSYIGEVVETHGTPALPRCTVTIRNYSIWYADGIEPFNSSHHDDEVRFSVNHKTRIETF